MSEHLEGVRRILSREAFEDFQRRVQPVLHLREEIARKFRDVYPPGREHLAPEGFCVDPWMVVWMRERGGLDLKTWHRLEYEEFVEWAHRNFHAISVCREALARDLSPEEAIQARWLCHLSHPPAYLVRPDLGFPSVRYLFGEYATTLWLHVDYWTGEFDWIEGFHNEKGVPVQYWLVGTSEEIAQHFDEEDREKLLTPSETVAAPRDLTYQLNLRDPATGSRIRDLPRTRPYELEEWVHPVREVVLDLRGEMFRRWVHANLYLSISPGNWGVGTQQNFWSISGFWGDPWLAYNNVKLFGHPIQYYLAYPVPPGFQSAMGMTKEGCIRAMAELFLQGPKGMLCDAVNKLITPSKKTPLLHSIRKLFLEGKMFKGFASPFDDGIPPPRALLTAVPAPIYRKDATIWDVKMLENPDLILKEPSLKPFRELLESEGGIDFKTGRVPSYEEVPRLKWLFDPTIEWLKPKDFPEMDWSRGQVWPLDLTREKMEIMVEEGYDGSGKDILHYSCLADRKLGQYGKTILLGTMPYKLPEE
jgi:hypothetical protein